VASSPTDPGSVPADPKTDHEAEDGYVPTTDDGYTDVCSYNNDTC
jgi:hypothetical protein